jgi:hypothetical protein
MTEEIVGGKRDKMKTRKGDGQEGKRIAWRFPHQQRRKYQENQAKLKEIEICTLNAIR